MTEPRFHASVTDPDNTAPITKEALDSLRGRERAGANAGRDAERAGQRDRADRDRGPLDDRQAARPHAAGEPVAGGDGGQGDRAGHGFRSAADRPESPFAARYVDPSYLPDSESAGHRGNGWAASAAPGYGGVGAESGRQSSPGGVPAAGAHSASGQRADAAGSPLNVGPSSGPTSAAGDPGRGASPAGYGGYGGVGYGGGYPSGETAAAGYGSQYSSYSSLTGSPSRTDLPPGGPGRAGAAGMGAATGGFVGGSTIGTAPVGGRPGTRGRTGSPPRPARRARLLVRHIDPWSTLKFSLVVAVALFFVWLVAIGVLYGVLDGMGVFNKINSLYDELSGSTGQRIITPGLVLGTATLVGAVNIVLMTALTTIGSFVYNICSDLVGGIEITLAERE